MTLALPGRMPVVLGFALPAGIALAMAGALLGHPVGPAPEEAQAARPAGVTQLYVALKEPLFIGMGTGPRMRLDLAVAVEGTGAQLLALNAAVEGAMARVQAAIVAEAQTLVLEGADSGAVHDALPARARAAINAMLGSADFPDPVREVLILGLVVQD